LRSFHTETHQAVSSCTSCINVQVIASQHTLQHTADTSIHSALILHNNYRHCPGAVHPLTMAADA